MKTCISDYVLISLCRRKNGPQTASQRKRWDFLVTRLANWCYRTAAVWQNVIPRGIRTIFNCECRKTKTKISNYSSKTKTKVTVYMLSTSNWKPLLHVLITHNTYNSSKANVSLEIENIYIMISNFLTDKKNLELVVLSFSQLSVALRPSRKQMMFSKMQCIFISWPWHHTSDVAVMYRLHIPSLFSISSFWQLPRGTIKHREKETQSSN